MSKKAKRFIGIALLTILAIWVLFSITVMFLIKWGDTLYDTKPYSVGDAQWVCSESDAKILFRKDCDYEQPYFYMTDKGQTYQFGIGFKANCYEVYIVEIDNSLDDVADSFMEDNIVEIADGEFEPLNDSFRLNIFECKNSKYDFLSNRSFVFKKTDNDKSYGSSSALKWIPEESRFVDYKINNGKVTVRYSIAFENFTEDDIEFSINAAFSKSETKGWLKNEILNGMAYDENNESGHIILHAYEKRNVVISFTGDYLGGKVNTNLSFPEEIAPVLIFD